MPTHHKRFRRNADEHRRRLERAAASGDSRARAELFIENLRLGKPVEEIALEVLGSLSVRELQGLHHGMANDLANDLAIARHTRPGGPNQGGWFPDHAPQDVCPRGHEISRGSGFDYNEVTQSWERAWEAAPDTLVLDGGKDWGDGDVDWTSCNACHAGWPNTSWEYR